MARYTRSNIDVILDKLSEETRNTFLSMTDKNTVLADLQLFLIESVNEEKIEIDFPVPCISAIAKWREKRKKISKQVEMFNALNTEFDGINGIDLVSRMTYEVAQYIFKAMEILNNDLENTPPQSLLKQLPVMLRECRALMDLRNDYNTYRSFESEVFSGYVLALEHIQASLLDTHPQLDKSLEMVVGLLRENFLEQLRTGKFERLIPNYKDEQKSVGKRGNL